MIKPIYKSIFFLLAFGTLVFTSCQKELLEKDPKGVLAEGVASAATIDKQVIAAYQALGGHFFGNDESFQGPSSNWIMDVRSDDAYKGGGGIGDQTGIHQLETATMDPTNSSCFQKWRNPYFGIARCNVAIREITNLEDDLYPKETRIAEMRFLRAHFHFDLKRNYNQIVYLDEMMDPTVETNTRFNEEELWDLIQGDMQFAFENLPTDHPEVGRITKYAAAAYLAKIAIERKQWAAAIGHCNFVMGGPFNLLDDFQELSELDFENSPEAVFAIQYSTANIFLNHNWGDLLNITSGPGINGGGYANGDDFYLASQNLVNAFKVDNNGFPLFDNFNNGSSVTDGNYPGPLDPRIDFTFGRLGIPWKGTANYDDSWVRSQDYYPGFSGKKHVIAPDDPRVHNSFPWAASGLNFSVIRYAEILLWKAEAIIESGGSLSEAIDLINQIRQRAKDSEAVKTLDGSEDAANYNISLYDTGGWTKETARQALRFERRLELAMEGHRFYDLNRWGITSEVMNNYYQTEGERVDYLQGSTFQANKHEYLPIPQGEIDLAPDLYSQNPGY